MAAKVPESQAPNGTRIYARIEEMDKKLQEANQSIQNVLTEVIKRIGALEVRLASMGTTKPRAAGAAKAAGGTGGVAAPKKKFAANSLAWFKELWKANRKATAERFFKAEQIQALDKHMAEDPKDKDKSDDARAVAEIKFIWDTYVAPSTEMKKIIKDAYDKSKEAHEAASKTPASKEKEDGEEEEAE